MIIRQVCTHYFSATTTTEQIVRKVADRVAEALKVPCKHHNFAIRRLREGKLINYPGDLIFYGLPVYAGRVPSRMIPYLKTIKAEGCLGVGIVVYGNRDFEDAVLELTDLMKAGGITVVAAGAFIGEHSYSKVLGKGRPDNIDNTYMDTFARKIAIKLKDTQNLERFDQLEDIPGDPNYMKKIKPPIIMPNGDVLDLDSIKPETNAKCINCKLCARLCPVGAIDFDDVSNIRGECMRCNACVKRCPFKGKSFTDERFLKFVKALEDNNSVRKQPKWWL